MIRCVFEEKKAVLVLQDKAVSACFLEHPSVRASCQEESPGCAQIYTPSVLSEQPSVPFKGTSARSC